MLRKLLVLVLMAVLLVPVFLSIAESKKPEKLIFIHYKSGKVKKVGGGKCYKFEAKGAKLEIPKILTINPEVDESAIWAAASEWDSHTSAKLFEGYRIDSSANWDMDNPDGRNEFSFGDYPEEGVIAVTVIWGYFRGPEKKIIEFDVMFDTDYLWQNYPYNTTIWYMDLQNIATHEIGHGLGLDDLYRQACSEETMYGYSYYGEIKKRTLEDGDIKGLQKLYGV